MEDIEIIDIMEDENETSEKKRWEKKYHKTWDKDIDENENDQLLSEQIRRNKRRKKQMQQQQDGKIRRGMSRNLIVIIDASENVVKGNIVPSRLDVMTKGVEGFIKNFFDQNPISQLGLMITRSEIAETLTELNGNPNRHLSVLKSIQADGQPSLQNSLTIAAGTLSTVPKYCTREILIVYSSLITVDSGNIENTIKLIKKNNIRCSIIGFDAEVFILKKIATATDGTYTVATNNNHFCELLTEHSPPPPSSKTEYIEATLINMGFPEKQPLDYVSLCNCHQELKRGGYLCPKCNSKWCDLPVDCRICGLQLVLSPHLARSYHHLFSIPMFIEIPAINNNNDYDNNITENCYSCCSILLSSESSYKCSDCQNLFCYDCDIYIHEHLHNCPGCLSL
eukprot:TRINITY_DN4416_c0_g1_i1.p1 TRINITY_DN4416_c0_g1~~TRINITY_DN4416_c0_g1_i1.p1  ORF type:complete len:395 (-),score=94.38 TRINITY_DN4416_c0_g1_i1:22-1206(-)